MDGYKELRNMEESAKAESEADERVREEDDGGVGLIDLAEEYGNVVVKAIEAVVREDDEEERIKKMKE